jgi:hypothetical protein
VAIPSHGQVLRTKRQGPQRAVCLETDWCGERVHASQEVLLREDERRQEAFCPSGRFQRQACFSDLSEAIRAAGKVRSTVRPKTGVALENPTHVTLRVAPIFGPRHVAKLVSSAAASREQFVDATTEGHLLQR